jgi:hypothetical protein
VSIAVLKHSIGSTLLRRSFEHKHRNVCFDRSAAPDAGIDQFRVAVFKRVCLDIFAAWPSGYHR